MSRRERTVLDWAIEKPAFWQRFRLYQAWRYIVLNVRILIGVYHSKRLPAFVIKYKVSYMPIEDGYPITVANTLRPPQIGDRLDLARNRVEIINVSQLTPPHGEFCPLQATCRIVGPATGR